MAQLKKVIFIRVLPLSVIVICRIFFMPLTLIRSSLEKSPSINRVTMDIICTMPLNLA